MATTYQYWVKLFERRHKGNDWKSLKKGALRLCKEQDGSFTFHILQWRSEDQPGGTSKWVRYYTPFMRITPESHLSFLDEEFKLGGVWRRSLVAYIVGAYSAYSAQGRLRRHSAPIRIELGGGWHDAEGKPWGTPGTPRAYKADVPLTPELVLDTAQHRILRVSKDVRYVPDRKRSKPIYEFANKAVKMTEVVLRLTAGAPPYWSERWHARSKLLGIDWILPIQLNDEGLARITEVGMLWAKARGLLHPQWIIGSGGGISTLGGRSIDDPAALAQHMRTFKRFLTWNLQKQHGLINEVPLTN